MPAKWLVSMTVLLGALMAVIDTSIVNVAMPHMAGGLGVGIDEITWVAISYMVANVIIMPLIYFFRSALAGAGSISAPYWCLR